MADQNGAAMQATLPTITVIMQPQPAGPNGEYYFEVQVGIAHMPGGWRTAHHGLCLALGKVLPELEKQVKGEGVVQIATQMPGHLTG